MPSKINKTGKIRWLACVKKNGIRKQKLCLTRSEALNWEATARRDLQKNKTMTHTVSLGDWATNYLNFAKTKFSEKTYKEKARVFKRFFACVKSNIGVDSFNAKHALDYLQKQAEIRSGHASNKDRKNLIAGWNWAIKFYDFPPNPFQRVDKFSEVRKPRYVPTEADFWEVYYLAQGQDKIMLLSCLHLAARRSELFRLTWADIDFLNSRVRLGTHKRKDGTLEYDWLPMTKELRSNLLKWWEERPIKDTEYVFVCLEKTPFCWDYYGKPFRKRQHLMKRLCEKAKVKVFGLHAIRHLTASVLYHTGQPVAVIQAILRHKSASTTERYLSSLGLEHTREALDRVFEGRGPGRVISFPKKEAPEDAASEA